MNVGCAPELWGSNKVPLTRRRILRGSETGRESRGKPSSLSAPTQMGRFFILSPGR